MDEPTTGNPTTRSFFPRNNQFEGRQEHRLVFGSLPATLLAFPGGATISERFQWLSSRTRERPVEVVNSSNMSIEEGIMI
jgi:hypothetical protein